MRKVTKHIVLMTRSGNDLENWMNEKAEKGWKLAGVTVYPEFNERHPQFLVAVMTKNVKREKPKKKEKKA